MKLLSKNTYVEGILAGNIVILSQAITLLESSRRDHNELAREILESVLPHTGNSFRIGVTGVPGVGKSTFIDAIGELLLENESRLAILAIDPSSQLTKGSILGDKTRMERLSGKKNVYIRPSAAGDTLGGVGRKTRETIMLCEAAGFNKIVVETVGVGQSEVAVHSMVDCFMLLLLPGAGDELQGIKRGIMEMADFIVLNKAYEDGQLSAKAKKAIQELQNALHYFPQKKLSWLTPVKAIDALAQVQIQELKNGLDSYWNHQIQHAYFGLRRKEQESFWFHETIKQELLSKFYSKPHIQAEMKKLEEAIAQGKVSSFKAADSLLNLE
ncbi:MAG: methylmalonyl Co-A mutase-associated GTPase MeaB [Bacteroidetes bacterium]|nr:methylmalonyl Co-A mutase-associated GTPase MeaB [Bacteroidota bacterium]